MTPETLAGCEPAHPTSILQIHGALDNTVPKNGNDEMEPIDEVMAFWKMSNRCDESPETRAISDLTLDGFGGTQSNYSNCENGVEVSLYLLNQMGHEWPFMPHLIQQVQGHLNTILAIGIVTLSTAKSI